MISAELKQTIKNLLADGEIEEALDLLINESQNQRHYNIVVTISGQFNELKRKSLTGVMEQEDEEVRMNQIRNAILEFLDNVQENNIQVNFQRKESFFQANKMAIIAGIAAIAIIAVVLIMFNKSSNQGNSNASIPPGPAPQQTPVAKPETAHKPGCASATIFNLEGKIGGKFGIKMMLKRINSKEFEGYYYYDKTSQRIPVIGEMHDDGYVTLSARVEGEMKAEKFEGTLGEDCNIKGTWHSSDGSRLLGFDLQKR